MFLRKENLRKLRIKLQNYKNTAIMIDLKARMMLMTVLTFD